MLIQNMTRTRKCKWCGRTFRVPKTREYNAVKYCCVKCSYYAYLEKHNEAQTEYMKRYKELLKRERLGNSGLGQHREEDFEKELEKVRKELNRIKRGLI